MAVVVNGQSAMTFELVNRLATILTTKKHRRCTDETYGN